MSRPPKRTLRPGQVRADEGEDIRQELELYLDLRTDELVAEGMDPGAARRLAEERFGDTRRIERELKRQARRRRARDGVVDTMGGLRQDLGYAVRTFRRSPGFTLVAVLTLGLALGGNTAIFSVVDAALLQAMPFERADELVYVNGYHLNNGEIAIRGASFPEFRDWRERSRTVSPMAAVGSISVALTGGAEAESVTTELVTGEYFQVLEVTPEVGRTFTSEEHLTPDAFPVAVISAGLAERRFGASSAAVGRDVILNDRVFTVVGVMPAGVGGISLGADVWIPESMITVIAGVGTLDARGSRFLSVIGRLTGDPTEAQQELDVIARDLQQEWPEVHEDRFAQIQDFRAAYLDTTGRLLWVLFGAGGVLLLIAAANVANLLLVRSHGRTREIVLRRALGAESRRVAGQLITESAALAVLGGAVGVGLAWIGLRALVPMIPQGVLPAYVQPGLSVGAFAFSLAVLALVGVAMGLVPAAASTRLDISSTLREGGRGGGGGRRLRAQHVFVVAQVGLALVLMVGAGLLTRSFRAQLAVDTGVEFEQVVAVQVSLPSSRYPSSSARHEFAAEIQRTVGAIPGVVNASVSSNLPFRGGSSGAYVFKQDALDERIRFHRHSVTPQYMETMGIRLASGRFLSDDDVDGSPGVGVITETMARRVFPDASAVGQTMYLRPGGEMGFEVVGVIEDVRYRDLTTSLLAEANSPDVFFSFAQFPAPFMEIAAQVQGDPWTFVPLLREAVAELDSDLPVFQPAPLIEAYRRQTATPRFAAFLMSLFSALAVVLACVGIYGVLAFTVGQRSREIAIRRAIGASAPNVAVGVVVDGLRLTGIGLAVGGIGALTGARVLEAFLFEVPSTDFVTFASVAAAMIAVATVAAVVPAVRATRRQPAEALGAD